MKTAHALLCVAAVAVLAPVTSFAYDGKINLNGTIQPTTCTLSAPNIDKTIPPVKPSDFNGVGSNAGVVGFHILLDCANVTSKVSMGMTDATNPGNTSTILSLTSDSTATGVGIEIVANGPVTGTVQYSPDTATPGQPGQFLILNGTGAASQPLDLAFYARFKQTGATVKQGSAKGAATYTLQYQ